jgi:hypothetical protein
VLVAAAASAQAPATPPPPGRVIGRAGSDLAAYATPPVCGPRVAVTIVATKPELFAGGVSPAARFFGGVRAGHSLSCPQMNRMVAKGLSGQTIMFSGMADRSNDWEAVILGSNVLDAATEARLGAQTGPSDQSVVAKSPQFLAAEAVLKQAEAANFLCVNASAGGCEMIGEFRPHGTTVDVINRYRAGGPTTQAVVTSVATLGGGFLCADSSQSKVVIEDPRLSADARADLVEQIGERVRQNGRVCTGFQGLAKGRMTMLAFSPSGRRLREGSSAQLVAARPQLAQAQ